MSKLIDHFRAYEPSIPAAEDDDVDNLPDDRVEAIGTLTEALKDNEWKVRKVAAEILGQLRYPAEFASQGDRQAVESLIQALGDDNQEVRRAAVDALARIGGPEVGQPLASSLGDDDPVIRLKAATELWKVGGEKAVETLIEALGDPSWEVQMAVATALGQLGDRRAVKPLLNALKTPHWQLRWRAAAALGWLGDDRAIQPLIRSLQDETSLVRAAACESLGRLWAREAIRPLMKALADGDPQVRETASNSLGRIGEPALEALIQGLESPAWYIRQGSVTALGRSSSVEVKRPLARALRDPHWRVREASLLALGHRSAVGPLRTAIEVMEVEHPLVERAREWIMGQGTPEIAPARKPGQAPPPTAEVEAKAAESMGFLSEWLDGRSQSSPSAEPEAGIETPPSLPIEGNDHLILLPYPGPMVSPFSLFRYEVITQPGRVERISTSVSHFAAIFSAEPHVDRADHLYRYAHPIADAHAFHFSRRTQRFLHERATSTEAHVRSTAVNYSSLAAL